jgi:hypothetical protein
VAPIPSGCEEAGGGRGQQIEPPHAQASREAFRRNHGRATQTVPAVWGRNRQRAQQGGIAMDFQTDARHQAARWVRGDLKAVEMDRLQIVARQAVIP